MLKQGCDLIVIFHLEESRWPKHWCFIWELNEY